MPGPLDPGIFLSIGTLMSEPIYEQRKDRIVSDLAKDRYRRVLNVTPVTTDGIPHGYRILVAYSDLPHTTVDGERLVLKLEDSRLENWSIDSKGTLYVALEHIEMLNDVERDNYYLHIKGLLPIS
jgi:hypothetical protein